MPKIILALLFIVSSSFTNLIDNKRVNILELVINDLVTSTMDYEMFEEKYMIKAEAPQPIRDFYCTLFHHMLEEFYQGKNSNEFSIVPYRNLSLAEKSDLIIEKHQKKDVYVISSKGQTITYVLFFKDKIQHIFVLDKGGRKYFM